MARMLYISILVIFCGCGSLPRETTQGKDKIFNLTSPNKEALKNASRDFIANIAADKPEMLGCAEKFLLTDEYQDIIYRKNIRSRRNADTLYFLYKNELAIALAKTGDQDYLLLLKKYYYPKGTEGMTDRDMLAAAVARLTYRGTEFYGEKEDIRGKASIDFREKTDLTDGSTLVIYTVKWPEAKEIPIFNTIFTKGKAGGLGILLPIQHNLVGGAMD